MAKKRYFAIVAHCLLNPSTRVHILGRRFQVAKMIADYFLSRNISMIQLPCPEFTAMGYLRNPQGRQQYDNVFFRRHCQKELESYVNMIEELVNNANTPLCFVGIQGSPTCSIRWGKHKINKYRTESITPEEGDTSGEGVFGIMTEVLDGMLRERGINLPYIEAPVKESVESDCVKAFFRVLDDLFIKHI
ncbi:MAG: hypothetical protein RR840_05570 [Clostridium sp.]